MMKLLSICIPTYNRSKILYESLKHIENQLSESNSSKLEILISDNCSSDDTLEVATKFIGKGLPIIYNRHKENLGPDGNFLYCINNAKGKYIWLLGDDDYIMDGGIDYLLGIMEGDYGLIHIKESTRHYKFKEYKAHDIKIFDKISFMLTFMSVNIINSSTIKGVTNPQQYFKSFFLQVPFYINAAMFPTIEKNIILYRKMLDCGHASNGNGGFNYFTVVVTNYLGIWRKAIKNGWVNYNSFKRLRREYYFSFIIKKINQYLIRKNIDANYDFTNSWSIIYSEYGKTLYFYWGFLYFYIMRPVKFIIKPIKKQIKNIYMNVNK